MDERSRRTASRTDTAAGGDSVRRRRVLKAGAGGALGVSLAGCLDAYGSIVGADSGDETVKIGLLAPDPTEGGEPTGYSMRNGAELAVDHVSDSGIDGKDVELIVEDTNGSARETKRKYQELVLDREVDVTVGIFSSGSLMNVMDDIAELETLHLTTGAASTNASDLVHDDYERYKYHFRVGPINDYDLGRIQLDFLEEMHEEIGWESIALLSEDYQWTEAAWELYEERLGETGVEETMRRRYSPARDSFDDLYEEVEASGADAAYVSMAHTGVEALLDWADPEEQYPFAFGGIHVPIQLPSFYETVGGLAKYSVSQASATPGAEITDKTVDFADEYLDAYGYQPVYTGYITYDAITMYADVATEYGTTDSSDLVDALEETSYTGTTGTIEFYGQDDDHTHDVVYGPDAVQGVYFQWQEDDDGTGIQEVIWPEGVATADYEAPDWI